MALTSDLPSIQVNDDKNRWFSALIYLEAVYRGQCPTVWMVTVELNSRTKRIARLTNA